MGQNAENKRIIKLVNKKPYFNKTQGIWGMDFKGKAPISSVKNMILVEEDN